MAIKMTGFNISHLSKLFQLFGLRDFVHAHHETELLIGTGHFDVNSGAEKCYRIDPEELLHSNSYFLDYRTIQIETSQIECYLDLVNFAKNALSLLPRLRGTCRISYREKREADEKNRVKSNTFVSILVPYSRPHVGKIRIFGLFQHLFFFFAYFFWAACVGRKEAKKVLT
jgi:hypothetical protein